MSGNRDLQRRRWCSAEPFPVQGRRSVSNSLNFKWDYAVPRTCISGFQGAKPYLRRLAALAYSGLRYTRSGVPTQQLLGCWVTANTFELLGIKPSLGRQITLPDGNPESPPVFAISDIVWAKFFNRVPQILGASLHLNEPIIVPYRQTGTLTLLLAGVVLLLIISCANCSMLLLARGRPRRPKHFEAVRVNRLVNPSRRLGT